MKIRIADRIITGLTGVLLLAACAGLVAQSFFQVDVIGFAQKILTTEKTWGKVLIAVAALALLLLGFRCLAILVRHRRKNDRFIMQKTDNGELAISLKALDNMVQKCLEQHPELSVQDVNLESRKDGLLVRIQGITAGGISIPLTVEALQKQIIQYVTACSGVEVKGIRVMIESTGPDLEDAPFSIAAPVSQSLLSSGEKKEEPAEAPETPVPAAEAEAQPAETEEKQPAPVLPEVPEEEEDDRPIHQRIFSTIPEPCFVPMPPEGIPEALEQEEAESEPAEAESEPENAAPDLKDAEAENTETEPDTAQDVLSEAEEESTEANHPSVEEPAETASDDEAEDAERGEQK